MKKYYVVAEKSHTYFVRFGRLGNTIDTVTQFDRADKFKSIERARAAIELYFSELVDKETFVILEVKEVGVVSKI